MPYLTSNPVAIHYRVNGDGSPLILQHGFSDSSETCYERGNAAALKSRFRLILPDTRGHGQSGKPHEPLAYTPAEFASDIVAVLDDIGIRKTCYWGYSRARAASPRERLSRGDRLPATEGYADIV